MKESKKDITFTCEFDLEKHKKEEQHYFSLTVYLEEHKKQEIKLDLKDSPRLDIRLRKAKTIAEPFLNSFASVSQDLRISFASISQVLRRSTRNHQRVSINFSAKFYTAHTRNFNKATMEFYHVRTTQICGNSGIYIYIRYFIYIYIYLLIYL